MILVVRKVCVICHAGYPSDLGSFLLFSPLMEHLIMGHMMFMLMQAAAHMWMDLTFQDTRGRLIGKPADYFYFTCVNIQPFSLLLIGKILL